MDNVGHNLQKSEEEMRVIGSVFGPLANVFVRKKKKPVLKMPEPERNLERRHRSTSFFLLLFFVRLRTKLVARVFSCSV